MKYLILPLIFFFQFSYAVEEEITSWFNQESEKFLEIMNNSDGQNNENYDCLLYTSPSPRDKRQSRMPSSA